MLTGELEFGDWGLEAFLKVGRAGRGLREGGGDRADENCCCDLTEGGGEGSPMPRAGWLHS